MERGYLAVPVRSEGIRRCGTVRPVPDWLVIALALVLGVFTGVLSAMFGVGGAVVSTPGIRALGAPPLEGVGSTLPSILPSAITGTLRYQREGLIRWDVVRWTAPFGAAMAIVGALVSASITGKGHIQMILTAVLVGYTAWKTSRPPTAAEDAVAAGEVPHHAGWRAGVIGAVSGTLSGFLGVGGGVLMVPAFKGWLKLPIKETVGTSLACVGMLAIPGTIPHQIKGNIDWMFAVPLCIGVVPGARWGAHFAVNASDQTLRSIIGVSLGTIAVVYGIAEVVALV